ncbi:MAG TPA: selenide, water dikinase SelD, partial [Thermoanaerobaculia bacterium]|nr:selenide, water dikinase SelD [Thermoanaerobaculia bacterium]
AIAAANALSDVYAMGGEPRVCLDLVGFPAGKLDDEVLHAILAGAVDKITEAGATLAGGHTTNDDEPTFGLSVAGIVHPEKVWRNIGVQAGDAIVLTKPIGSGVLFNANLKRLVSDDALEECVRTVTTLNKSAADVLHRFEVHAVTDVTGFGLAGHAMEMAAGSGVTMHIDMAAVPIMREALAMYERGVKTGANFANRQMVSASTRFARAMPPWQMEIWFDPQTSGGLLAAVPAGQAAPLLEQLAAAGLAQSRKIGAAAAFDGAHHLVFE